MDRLNDYDRGRWDMLRTLSSADYGKQVYLMEPSGTVYSRISHQYMSLNAALLEYCDRLSWDGNEEE